MTIDELLLEGRIGGRTAHIVASGNVDCAVHPTPRLGSDDVLIRTVRTAISPGTEMTFVGRDASNVYLHKHWNEELRLFEAGSPSIAYPMAFGYRAAGEVVESRSPDVAVGHRVYGNWPHTELTSMPAAQALAQTLPDALDWDDGVDMGQMGPICVNAVAFGAGDHRGAPTVVFGAGPVGLLTAQIARADGAARVYVVDRLPSRLAIAASLGLEPIEADGRIDVAATIKRRHGAEGIPVAFECTGSSIALQEAIRVVRRRGVVVAVGFYQGDAIGLRLGDEFHHNGVRITCGQIGNIHPGQDWASLRAASIELGVSRRVTFGGLPRLTVPIERVAAGIDALSRPDEILQVAISYDAP
jgi:NADPH:quinone reductase-like Zn-dependent oxidoreductase